MRLHVLSVAALATGCVAALTGCSPDDTRTPTEVQADATAAGAAGHAIRHVLLISIDGFHEHDLASFTQSHPGSALAHLRAQGTLYNNATGAKPSDSFPGLLAMLTGGSPATTGVYYDDSYSRLLSPPGSACATTGTEVVYDESIDRNTDLLGAGGGIDPAKLPLDPRRGCTPVYPHAYLRVNTVFEVAKAAGLRTAWADKHPAYDLVNGPSGHGVDDLYTPEIASLAPTGGGDWTTGVGVAEAYDDKKVRALLREIDGQDHDGDAHVGVPGIFGMNFQAVSVGQKTAGYLDAAGTPSPGLTDALEHTDGSIGKLVGELERQGLSGETAVIISAKHGQSPIDPSERRVVDKAIVRSIVEGVQPGLLAQATEDDIALIWLTRHRKTADVVSALKAHKAEAGISSIIYGDRLAEQFDDPKGDGRTPDIIVQPERGVIYTSPNATKLAEHGGFLHPDTHVPILIAGPGLDHQTVTESVDTRQIAPTILKLLGLRPSALRAVAQEGTQVLPDLHFPVP